MILTSASYKKPRESCKGHNANWQGNWLIQAYYILYCAQPYSGEKEAEQTNELFSCVHIDSLIPVRSEYDSSAEGECIQLYWQN